MKKVLLIAAIAVFGLTSANAQDVSFGAKAGLNLASLSGDGTEDLDSRTSFHLGLVAEIMLSDKFAVQPEVLYSAQGAKMDDVTLQLDYLAIPIMAKYFVTEGLSIEAGPQIAFNIKSQLELDGETADIEDVEGMDLGLGLGLGYELNENIFFQGRYNLGFTEYIEGSEVTNSVIQFSVGYMF